MLIHSTPTFTKLSKHKMPYLPPKISRILPYCEISNCAQMLKTIIAVRHFELGGCKSLEITVRLGLG